MTWQPVIVGVNGSEESVRAAVMAAMIARRMQVDCTAVFAAPDYARLLGGYGLVPGLDWLPEERSASDRGAIATSLRGYVPAEMVDALEVRTGRAALILEEIAGLRKAGLIVVGKRYRRGMDRIGRDTVRHLVRTSEIPLLVASGGGPGITRVLAAVDLSYATRPTIEAAARWAALFGARLRVMYACEPLPSDALPGALPPERRDCEERAFDALIRPWVEPADEIVLRHGRADITIVRETDRWHADLLVVGSHGRGFVDRLLIGSTTERLLRRIPVPTLVVPVAREAGHSRGTESLPWEQNEVVGTGCDVPFTPGSSRAHGQRDKLPMRSGRTGSRSQEAVEASSTGG